MRSNRILLKATKFYTISLNSLQISLEILLQISLWMSFMYFTAYFITDFTADFIMDFTANFMLNHPVFITCIRISLKINKISWNLQHFTGFCWKQQDFIIGFTVDSIPVKSVMKFIMKSANAIHSEIHNEILLILVKSVEFNDIQKWHEKAPEKWKEQLYMKSAGAFDEKHNCSWKAQVLFMKSTTVHEKHRFSFERPLARNCNPMFCVLTPLCFLSCITCFAIFINQNFVSCTDANVSAMGFNRSSTDGKVTENDTPLGFQVLFHGHEKISRFRLKSNAAHVYCVKNYQLKWSNSLLTR